MEDKIGEVESDISFDEYKLAVRGRYRKGDRGTIIVGFLYILSGLIMLIYAPDWEFAKYALILYGLIMFWAYFISGKNIKNTFELLKANGDTRNQSAKESSEGAFLMRCCLEWILEACLCASDIFKSPLLLCPDVW